MKEYDLNKQKLIKKIITVLIGFVFLSINFVQQITYFNEHPYYFIEMYLILFLILIIIANIYKIFEWKPFLIYTLIAIILITIRLAILN
jgi:hypothetical protein